MAMFVLVHGGWFGGWCWQDLAEKLRAKEHSVYTPTLTGLGERAHLVSAQITLKTQCDGGLFWDDYVHGCAGGESVRCTDRESVC